MPQNKGMKQTSVEHIGRSQLIPGVSRTIEGIVTRTAAILVAGAVLSCNVPEMERVPTEEEVRNWPVLEPFLASPAEITGVYRNLDVDAVVFYYRCNLPTEAAFWAQLEEQATAGGWTAGASSGQAYRTYQRLQARGSKGFASAEEARIAYTPARVVVGYVQSDQWRETPKPVAEASEGRFADEAVWPKFRAAVSGGAG